MVRGQAPHQQDCCTERPDPRGASLLLPVTSGHSPQGTSACPSLGQTLPLFCLRIFSLHFSRAAQVWSLNHGQSVCWFLLVCDEIRGKT